MAAPGFVGVVGGMGPLVSAEFLKTIYSLGEWTREQDSPRVIVYSDPTFPDRTELLLRGEEEPLARRLGEAIEGLTAAGASSVVIACVTIHQVLERLPEHLRQPVVSLIDTAIEAIASSDEPHLLFCTSGTRRLGLFERHPAWARVRDRVVMPSDEDQAAIHDLIYRVKSRHDSDLLTVVDELLRKYRLRSFVAGCTELHLAAARFAEAGAAMTCVDPLWILADRIAHARPLKTSMSWVA